ncbi:MAG: hypothetical protein QGI80_02985, partial [archaeon]|nr:hypothetical protein [archaeon]
KLIYSEMCLPATVTTSWVYTWKLIYLGMRLPDMEGNGQVVFVNCFAYSVRRQPNKMVLAKPYI